MYQGNPPTRLIIIVIESRLVDRRKKKSLRLLSTLPGLGQGGREINRDYKQTVLLLNRVQNLRRVNFARDRRGTH